MTLLALGLAMILGGGIAAWGLARRPAAAERVFRWMVATGCALGLVPAVAVLFVAGSGATSWPGLALTRLPFGIDPLSAWFLLPMLGVGGAAALFGVSYLRGAHEPRRTGRAHLLLSILIVSLAGAVTARTIIAFMAAWEVMAVTAYFLVIFEHEEPGVARAGMIYVVLTHVATLSLLCMFAWWSGGGPLAWFDELAPGAASAAVSAGVPLMLGLVAFGIKAGMVPFHFWLPGAHAAAPSHVSALLSGVMLKVGIYGLFRIILLAGSAPAWWGWTVLLLGVASAILGVLWALAQHDLKRLLAYHSVENIGIILMGLGLGVLGSAYHHPAVALLGYAGALLHTINHAVFKSLLFLGAGTVVRATGTREIDRLGGLARRMPQTALLFLVGSVAIVGLPPLNGFVSEWLIFTGLLSGGIAGGELRTASVTTVGLALTGALALACFAKVFGVVFLGRPRHALAISNSPESPGMLGPQWFLAGCCAVIGLAPALVLPAAVRVANLVIRSGSGGAEVPLAIGSAVTLSLVSAGVLALGAVVWGIRTWTLAARPRVAAPTWGCGFPSASARMQYTASSCASPLLTVFGPLAGNRIVSRPGALHTEPRDPVLDVVGQPAWKWIRSAASELRVLQSGGIRWYLLYTILTLIGLLVFLRFVAAR